MNASDAGRRYTETELALILKSAAEMQAHDPGRPHGVGMTLSEIEAIASEAGIDAAYIQRAVAGLRTGGTVGLWHRLAGSPSRFQAQRILESDIGDDDTAMLVDLVRAEFGRHGDLRDALGGVEWKAGDDWGSSYVSVRNGAGSTRIVVGSDRNDTAWALGLVSPILGAIVGGIATSLLPIEPVLAASLGVGGGLAAARLAWGRIAAHWHARVNRVADDLTSVVQPPR
jgi:hypothetical protein